MEKELYQFKSKIDYVFTFVNLIVDEELMSHYSKYLCVLVSGYIENTLKTILKNYIDKCSAPKISNYINKCFKNITNLKDAKLQEILGAFSNEWKNLYINTITDKQKDALDSVVANRNLIVHGKSVGITYIRIFEYYKQINLVVCNLKLIIK